MKCKQVGCEVSRFKKKKLVVLAEGSIKGGGEVRPHSLTFGLQLSLVVLDFNQYNREEDNYILYIKKTNLYGHVHCPSEGGRGSQLYAR